MTQKPLSARIEVFRPGTFKPMEGEAITYSASDLKAIADAYDPATAPAPIVVGHPTADAPAFGWVETFEYDPQEQRLFANIHQIEPKFAELVKLGRFKKVSMAFFSPRQAHNPIPGTWYPKHVGFLGAAAPAVSGLKNAAFAGAADAVFTASFGEGGFEETASILRLLRDFLIGKFSLEDADKALPSYRIEWLGEMEIQTGRDGLNPSYAEDPAKAKTPTPIEEEPAVTKQPDPAFAALEANLNTRAEALALREAKLVHDDNAAFAESLIKGGRLLPVLKDKVVAIFDALPTDATVSFAEGGEKISPTAALREIFEALPQVVSFGEQQLGDDPAGSRSAAFAADGKSVDAAGLVTHNKALEYQRSHPGTAYLVAVTAVS